MKVRVEMEIPENCEQCKFFTTGTLYCWCKFSDDFMRLDHIYNGRSTGCPLEKCEVVDENAEQ